MSEELAPSTIEVTVRTERGARGRRRWIAGALLVAAVAGVILAGVLAIGHGGSRRPVAAGPSASGGQGVDAAYGFAQRCLIVSTLKGYARVDFNRNSPCGRYGGAASAIFDRSHGAWRPALEAVQHSCPVRSLPRAVQVELGVCQ